MFTARKQREVDSSSLVLFPCSFSFTLGPLLVGWQHLHPKWVYLSQVNLPGNALTEIQELIPNRANLTMKMDHHK